MPGLGKVHYIKFPDSFGFLPDTTHPIGLRRINSEYDPGYYVVADPVSDLNQGCKGEIIGRFIKEDPAAKGRKKTVFAAFSLDSLVRGTEHIRLSEQQRLQQLEYDMRQLEQTEHLLRHSWLDLSDQQQRYLSGRLLVQAHHLASAVTSRRQKAGDRLARYHELRDSLGRLNPLIVSGQLRAAVKALAEQLDLDNRSISANERRQLFALELRAAVGEDINSLMGMAQNGFNPSTIPRVQELLDGLRVKPFAWAADYLLAEEADELRVQAVLRMELRLLAVSDALATLQHNPELLQQADIKLEFLFNDLPKWYGPLVRQLVVMYGEMIAARMAGDNRLVGQRAREAKHLIRYRQELMPLVAV